MEVVEVPVPQPKPNDAVVKLAASGVNFIDVYFREGRYKAPLPFVLGQEGAGVVTAVGADVKSVKVGDRVAWSGTRVRMRNMRPCQRIGWCRFRKASAISKRRPRCCRE